MLVKNHLSKIVILCLAGMAFLTQPVQSYESGLGIGLPSVGTVALGAKAITFRITGSQNIFMKALTLIILLKMVWKSFRLTGLQS